MLVNVHVICIFRKHLHSQADSSHPYNNQQVLSSWYGVLCKNRPYTVVCQGTTQRGSHVRDTHHSVKTGKLKVKSILKLPNSIAVINLELTVSQRNYYCLLCHLISINHQNI